MFTVFRKQQDWGAREAGFKYQFQELLPGIEL